MFILNWNSDPKPKRVDTEVLGTEIFTDFSPYLIGGGSHADRARDSLRVFVRGFVAEIIHLLEKKRWGNKATEERSTTPEILNVQEEFLTNVLRLPAPVLRRDREKEVREVCEKARDKVIAAYKDAS